MGSPKICIHKTGEGFTLMEILIVISLFFILAGFGLAISMDAYRSFNFASDRDLLVSLLQKARSQSLNNVNQSPHGVYIAAASYVLFQGSNYISRDQSEDLIFPHSADLSLSGLPEVIFTPLSATTSAGNIILDDHIHPQSAISLNGQGQINLY